MPSSPLSPAQLRALFPALRTRVFLNAAASSPLPTPVEACFARLHRETLEQGDLGFGAWLREREEVRAAVARLLNASTSEVAFTPSTSMGFHAVASTLRARGVREVVTLETEFPSTTVPLLNAGLRLRAVPPRSDGSYPFDDIVRAVGPQTGALALSAVQYASGFRQDLAPLGAWCRARGLRFAVNACQALGQVPVDVREAQADFVCGTSHKWLWGGFGCGVFFARDGALDGIAPPFAGWLSAEDAFQMNPFPGARREPGAGFTAYEGVRLVAGPRALETGASSFATVLALGAALKLVEQVGVRVIAQHNQALQAVLREGLRRRGFRPTAPDEPGSGICTVRVQAEAPAAVAALLAEGVVVSARGGGVRISTHAYNDEADLARFFEALDRAGVKPEAV